MGPTITIAKMASDALHKIHHYVLVHGACHGAWCWYKLKPLLQSAGHRVSVLDLAASGIHPAKLQDLRGTADYTDPLFKFLASLPSGEKVVLVGHSLGGVNLALAADRFPNKIAVAVFVTAFLPDTDHKPSYVIEQYIERTPSEAWLDTQFSECGSISAMLFGPKFLSFKLYHLSPPEDLELAKTLIRPGSLFVEDLSKSKLSKEGYESVPRAYIVCDQDMAITQEFQLWMIQNAGVSDVLEIKNADHMAMLAKPRELCDALLQIAPKYVLDY